LFNSFCETHLSAEEEHTPKFQKNFPPLWHKWIIECVTTAMTSVLLNGSPTDEFKMEIGLRQGDPLSPFLFLLTVEGFNVMMNAVVANGLFTGSGVRCTTMCMPLPYNWL